MSGSKPKAIVLLSGGLDSTTCVAIAQRDGYQIYGLSFNYGQRHDHELQAAHRVAEAMGVQQHIVAQIDLRAFGGSALTSDSIDVPKSRTADDIGQGIPITYVPARNTVFLSFALAWAEVLKATDIFIGVNALDYSGYPDCRPAFIAAFENLANNATALGTEAGARIKVHAPLIDMTKAQIVSAGTELGVDYGLTFSCYDPQQDLSCGRCDACLLRKKGFTDAGAVDPLTYAQ